MLTEISGDLIKLAKANTFDVITHGCNCKKNFGAGLALSLKKAYPEMYQNDLDTVSTLGTITFCKAKYQELILVNSYTQYYPGKNGHGKDTDFHRYEAITNCMKEINIQFKGKHIGLPLIGCGLAGLKWNKVKKIFEEELVDMKVTVVHYK